MTRGRHTLLLRIVLAAGVLLIMSGVAVAQIQVPTKAAPAQTRPKIEVVISAGGVVAPSTVDVSDTYAVNAYQAADLTDTRSDTWLETARYKSKGTPVGFDVAGAAYPFKTLGFGVGFSSVSPAGDASLNVRVKGWPASRNFPDVQDTKAIDFKASSQAIHIQVRGRFTIAKDTTVEVFGGPTFFRGKFNTAQQTSADFDATVGRTTYYYYVGGYLYYYYVYDYVRPTAITWEAPPVTTVERSFSKVGFNVGADFSRFFTKNIGVGGQIRYSATTVTVDGLKRWNPEADDYESRYTSVPQNSFDVRIGGVQASFGIRFRI